MLRKTILVATLSCLYVGLFAQNYGCATDEYLEQLLESSESARAEYHEQQDQFDIKAANGLAARDEAEYIIPVVVHVIYSTCEGNVSKSQIDDGIRIINEDFGRYNEDANLTRSEFQDVAADAGIEFRLAKFDPSGNPTNGINRIQSNAAVGASNNVKSLSYWSSSKYMNIWLVESIENFTGGSGIILGYAQFPGSGSWNTYGLVCRNDAFGTIGTSSADGRTVTHEIGHCLNLRHTFQDGCGSGCSFSGDRVCDTPPATSDPTYNCSFSTNTCSNDAGSGSAFNSNVPDQIENYMSYNSCQNMFTEGQKTRMVTALNTYGPLENLVSEDNLIETGVKGLVKAQFSTSTDIICTNTPVIFTDNSLYSAQADSWEFGGSADPAESTESNPEVSFPFAGLHTVSYTAKTSNDSETINQQVFVVSEEGQFAPYSDDLESTNSIPNDNWYVINPDEDEFEWKISTEAAYSGDKSIKFDNYGSCGESIDELVSQSFDFSPFSSVKIEFAQAYARGDQGNQNFLRLYGSTDCGENWSLLWARSGTAIQTVSQIVAGPYIPENDEWNEQELTLTQQEFLQEGVLLKWQFGGTGGNNLYLDDIDINGVFSGEVLLRSPSNGKLGLAKDVLLDWKSAGAVDNYEYELDTSPDFDSENLISGTTEGINSEPNNEDTEAYFEDLMLDTKYYWRVRTVESGVNSEWSETWNFTVDETGVGVADAINQPVIKVYPNPTNGAVNIESNAGINQIDVMDYTGRIVWSENANKANRTALNAPLASGIYLIKINLEGGIVQTKQLIIQ